MILALATTAAVVGNWPIVSTVVFAAVLLAVLDLTLRSPANMATISVVACWLVVCVPLGRLFPKQEYQAVGLALLALPVAFVALRLRGYVPWRTTLVA
ncbi:MAG: hypothetical protein QOE54_5368, partial [Streptosporangiaceae bacterium]|nr:hypothetical protein [Streptosporangiaceae bacterium]